VELELREQGTLMGVKKEWDFKLVSEKRKQKEEVFYSAQIMGWGQSRGIREKISQAPISEKRKPE